MGERPKWAKFIHLSKNDLGEEFTFTPRIPTQPFKDIHGDPIEDMITKRTSWAEEVEQAVDAISPLTVPVMYIYGTSKLPGEVDCADEYGSHCKDDLAYEDKEQRWRYDDKFSHKSNEPKAPGWKSSKQQFYRDYGTDWVARDYAEKAFKDPVSLDVVKNDLELCVPDAPETDEMWATGAVDATKIGEYDRRGMVTWYEEENELDHGPEEFWNSTQNEMLIREYIKRVLAEDNTAMVTCPQ